MRKADVKGVADAVDNADGAVSETRDRLAEAALACFIQFGIDKTSMDDIALEANLSRPTVYRYFKTKADLVKEVDLRGILKINNAVRINTAAFSNPADQIVEAMATAIEVVCDDPYLRTYVRRGTDTVIARHWDETAEARSLQKARLGPIIEAGIRSGVFAADVDIDQAVDWIVLIQVALMISHSPKKLGPVRLRHLLRRHVLLGLVGQASSLESVQPTKRK